MKKLPLLILTFFAYTLTAQSLDVTAYSQNIALADSQRVAQEVQRQIAAYPSISESYEIPSYGLYQRYWDTNHLRSKLLEIPFSNDRLMLMLVQDANNPFVMPCQFDKIRTTYGEQKNGDFHPGIDLKTEPQTLVKSCFDGVVRMACDYGDYGTLVVVRHYNGLETVYAHLDKLCVQPNQIVKAGQVIGQTGTTGNTKECVLHFEIRFMNEYFDPETVIDFDEEDVLQNNMALMSRDFNILPLNEVGSWKPNNPKPKTTAVENKPEQNQQPEEKPKQEVKTPVHEGTTDLDAMSPENSGVTTQQSENQPAPKPQSTTEPAQPTADTEAVYHTVAAGENLYRISLKYNTTVDKILKLNNLKNADRIIEGQKIRVK